MHDIVTLTRPAGAGAPSPTRWENAGVRGLCSVSNRLGSKPVCREAGDTTDKRPARIRFSAEPVIAPGAQRSEPIRSLRLVGARVAWLRYESSDRESPAPSDSLPALRTVAEQRTGCPSSPPGLCVHAAQTEPMGRRRLRRGSHFQHHRSRPGCRAEGSPARQSESERPVREVAHVRRRLGVGFHTWMLR